MERAHLDDQPQRIKRSVWTAQCDCTIFSREHDCHFKRCQWKYHVIRYLWFRFGFNPTEEVWVRVTRASVLTTRISVLTPTTAITCIPNLILLFWIIITTSPPKISSRSRLGDPLRRITLRSEQPASELTAQGDFFAPKNQRQTITYHTQINLPSIVVYEYEKIMSISCTCSEKNRKNLDHERTKERTKPPGHRCVWTLRC